MEESVEFLPKLEEALAARQSWLDQKRSLQLKESFYAFQTHLNALLDLLLRKGQIREDPYGYREASAEIVVPPDEAIPENEKRDQVSWRLAVLRQQVEYVISSDRFETGDLDPVRLRRLASLISYLPWRGLSEGSTSPTNRVVAQMVASLRMGSDRVIAVATKDTVNQLATAQGRVLSLLGEFSAFHQEQWKLELRRRLLPRLSLTPEKAARQEEVLRAVRRVFPVVMPNQPFHRELFDDVIAEQFAVDAAERRAGLLARLAEREPAETVEKRQPPKQPDRQALLDALRHLARSEGEFSSALATLEINVQRSAGPHRGLGALLRRLAELLTGQQHRKLVLEVEYPAADGWSLKHESINLSTFLEAGRRKMQILASLADEAGPVFSRLAAAPDQQLLEYVEHQLSELFLLHRRLGGVNAKLQAQTPVQWRSEIKGIKLELTAVKNFLVKANLRKHEYTTQLEELRQFEAYAKPTDAGS